MANPNHTRKEGTLTGRSKEPSGAQGGHAGAQGGRSKKGGITIEEKPKLEERPKQD